MCLNVGGYALSWTPPSRTEIVIQFERQILFPMQIIFAVFFLLTSRWHLKQCDFQLSSAALYHRLVVCVRVCVCVVFFSGLCVTHANRGSVRPKIQTEKTHTGLMQMGRMYCVCVCADGRRANVRKIRHAWSTGV